MAPPKACSRPPLAPVPPGQRPQQSAPAPRQGRRSQPLLVRRSPCCPSVQRSVQTAAAHALHLLHGLVDGGRSETHQATAVATEIGNTDVVAPDDEDVGLACPGHLVSSANHCLAIARLNRSSAPIM